MDEEKQVSGEQESRGLSFKDILYILRKSWIAIVVFILAGAVGGFVWSKVEQKVAPVYRSSGIIMVSPEGNTNQTSSADYTMSNNLTKATGMQQPDNGTLIVYGNNLYIYTKSGWKEVLDDHSSVKKAVEAFKKLGIYTSN